MSYNKLIGMTNGGLFIQDPTFDFQWTLLDNFFEVWTYPITGFDFLKLKFGYSKAIKHKRYQEFLTDKDRVVFDLLSSADAEYLMENKQFMREFEISYRFLKSLGLDGTYRSYKKH